MHNTEITLGELSERIAAELRGNSARRISGVAALDMAGPEHLSFIAAARFRTQLVDTRAGVVILADRDLEACPVDALIVEEPYLAYAQAVRLLCPPVEMEPGISPAAHIAPDAQVHATARVEAGSVIEAEVEIGDGVWIGPGCIVGRGAVIGAGTRLLARVSVLHGAQVGRNVVLHPGAVIGADGFGFARDNTGRWINIPQQGGVCLGDDVEIGANSTIDRGTLRDTVIGAGVKIDNQVHVGHNAEIGAHTVIAGCTGIGGSVEIGPACRLGGGCGVASHVHITGGVSLAAGTQVGSSIKTPGVYASALTAVDIHAWRRNTVSHSDLAGRLRRINRSLEQLGASNTPDVSFGLDTPVGVLEAERILQLLPHRYPFMLIDRVIDCSRDAEKGPWLKAVKNVSFNEPFFQGHFPGLPVMPGVLVLEALAQAAAILYMLSKEKYDPDALLYLTGLDKTRIKRPVRPGDQLVIEAHCLRIKRRYLRCSCEARVEGEVVVATALTAMARGHAT